MRKIPKKLVSAFLSLIMVFALVPAAAAESCRHNYKAQSFPADCQNPERTVYTCAGCGDTYTKYAWEYNEPNGFGIVFDTVRSDENSTLTLTAEILNNPGLLISHMTVSYNPAVLKPVSYTNGVVWEREDYISDVSFENNPIRVYTEKAGTEPTRISGRYYTMVFDILDADAAYGLSYYINGKNFVDWDGHCYTPQVIDLTGKRELGKHSFETVTKPAGCMEDGYVQKVCRVCKTVESTEILPAVGHSYGKNYVEDESVRTAHHGHFVKVCAGCGDRIETVLPFKGDANNDGKVNAVDSNIIKQYLVGILNFPDEVGMYAVDINGDNKINSVDMSLVKFIILGME